MAGFAHFLRCVGNAVVKNGGRALAGLVPFGDVLYEIATSAYDDYRKDRSEPELRAELQGLAQASPAEVHRVVEEIAAREPVEVRLALVSYLDQLPAAVHQSLRRPSDPGGTTVPPGRSLSKPEDLLPFLPAGLPRFKPGDQPLAADWELVELLGKGGFGEVWKARHLTRTTQKPVALKFCLDPVAARSLRNEATLHDLLDRVRQQGGAKGIVPLLETYLRADPPCLMYELIEGGDLTGFIQEMHQGGRLTPELATLMVHRLAATVAFAHNLDPPLVHRDLKPSNVLVRREEGNKIRLFVADFGIGGLAASQSIREQAGRVSVRSRTLPTAVRGAYSPLYASPQQVQGERPDPRDDVHALGVVWYQLVTGDLKLAAVPPDWRDVVEERGLREEQIRLLASCIASRPERRLANAAELADRLTALRQQKDDRRREEEEAARLAAEQKRREEEEAARQQQDADRVAADQKRREEEEAARQQQAADRHNQEKWRQSDPRLPHDSKPTEPPPRQKVLGAHASWIPCVRVSPDGRTVASAGNDAVVRIWSLQSGEELFALRGHAGQVLSVSFSPDGSRLVSGGGKEIRMWDVVSGQELTKVDLPSAVVWCSFAPDGGRLAWGLYDGVITLWDIKLGKELRTLNGCQGGFSPDWKFFAAANRNKTITITDVESGEQVRTTKPHTGLVQSVAYSPDGTIFTSAGNFKSVRLWDAKTAKELAVLEGHTGFVRCIAFSPGGDILASGSADSTLRLWDVSTGRELTTLTGHTDICTTVCFTPDGRQIVSGSADRTIRLWQVPKNEQPPLSGEATKTGDERDANQVAEDGVSRRDQRRIGEKIKVTIAEGVELTLAYILPGTFRMGEPGRQVTLTKAFWIGVFPVTQAQWLAVTGKNPSRFAGPNRPVENVRWYDCQQFCRLLSERTGREFRLPTEAEWEYCCRAGTTTPFSFGGTISTEQANYDGRQTYRDGKQGVYRGETTPVTSFPANAWGLHDMHGNVWEWCEDWDDSTSSEDATDPLCLKNTTGLRVRRGGCWCEHPGNCCSAFREALGPAGRRDCGFRVVMCLDSPKQAQDGTPQGDEPDVSREDEELLDRLVDERAKAGKEKSVPALDTDYSEEVVGETPHGGVRSVAYFTDAEGKPCPKAQAACVKIVELDESGDEIFRTYMEKGDAAGQSSSGQSSSGSPQDLALAERLVDEQVPKATNKVRVRLKGGGALVLQGHQGAWRWSLQGDVSPAIMKALSVAGSVTEGYYYAPGDGYPGYRLACMVAEKLGGEAILPPLPPAPEGVVY